MCDCLPPPPLFDVGPPPDVSLIWHLLSDEPYQRFDDCEWDPFVSVIDEANRISRTDSTLAVPNGDRKIPLFLGALAALLLLCILCTIFAVRLRRQSSVEQSRKKKTPSADHILTAPDSMWSYNSMKTTPNHHGSVGMLMYGDMRQGGSMVFHKTLTPTTLRCYRNGDGPLRQSSTTIRLNNGLQEAYHTLGHYEEIPTRMGQLQSPIIPVDYASAYRQSTRRPPPTSKPPPPPPQRLQAEYVEQHRKFHSPGCSDSSLDNELVVLHTDSPQVGKRWDDATDIRSRLSGENGRESGYGTTPSGPWASPPNTSGRVDILRREHPVAEIPEAHSMTYV
ncbi:unnamed protein product, partial [Mesorhabditis spiculigera]